MIRRVRLVSRTPIQRRTRHPGGLSLRQVNPDQQARKRKKYGDFLKSAAWRRIRAQKLRESPTCELQHQGCVGAEQPTVHHLTYLRFGGQELMSDLQRACAPCHRTEDASRRRRRL